MKTTILHRVALLLGVLSGTIFGMAAHALPGNRYYVGPDGGNWSDPSNWSDTPGGAGGADVPIPGDSAYLTASVAKTVNFDASYLAPLPNVQVDGSGGALMTVSQTSSSAAMYAHNNLIGVSGQGHYVQSDGTSTVDTSLANDGWIGLGINAGAVGTYDMSGGAINITSFRFNGGLIVGHLGTGTFNLQSGTVNANANLGVGNGGTGTFNHTGGSVTVGTPTTGFSIFMGREVGANGQYNLSEADGPATLTVNGNIQLGYLGHGTFTQNGGVVTLQAPNGNGGHIFIANATSAAGSYTINSGTLSATSVRVGGDVSSPGGPGAFNVLGGAVNAALRIWPNGTVNLNGGMLEANPAPFGGNIRSDGQLNIADGATVHTPDLLLGLAAGTTSTLTMSGGAVMVGNSLLMGDCTAGANGVVNFSGGTLLVSNAAQTATLNIRSGHFIMTGGTLVVNKLILNNPCGATFNHIGGTLVYNELILDPNGDADGDGLSNNWEQTHGLDPLSSRDTTAPVVQCPSPIVVSSAPGQCAAVVSFTATATDDSGVATVVCTPASGFAFAKGTTAVNCTATDGAGNQANCAFAVTVNDTESPVLNCPANLTIDCGTDLLMPVDFAVAATDSCDPTPTVTCTPVSGSSFPIGTTTVYCSARDASGNAALCSFTVTRTTAQYIYRQIKSFGNPEQAGAVPYAGVIEGSDGTLFGTTLSGGSANGGTVFRSNKDGSGYHVLHNFGNAGDGAGPLVAVIEGNDGALYGTTENGGNGGGGTVFKINKDGTGYAVLRNFGGNADGFLLYGGVTQGNDGALYGTTLFGGSGFGGTVFKMNRDGTGYVVLHHFKASIGDGYYPYTGVTQGRDGVLYGTTQLGGSGGGGTVFKLKKDGSEYAVLHNFRSDGSAERNPRGGILEGVDGALYGTTLGGTPSLFRLNKDGSGYAILRQNIQSAATLTQGRDRSWYGTIWSGGIFRMSEDGSTLTWLRTFTSQEGNYVYANVLEGSDGILYATASQGGSGGGTLFKVNKDGSSFGVLHRFDNGASEGVNPSAGVIIGSDGDLYGRTSGGQVGGGTVFRVNKDGGNYRVLQNLQTGDHDGGVVQGNDGVLYGTQQFYAFRINPDGADFRILANLNYCLASPLLGPDQALYGVTFLGGAGGTLFKLTSDGNAYSVLHNFSVGDGLGPRGSLIVGSDGALYGTTSYGDNNGGGTVFKMNTDGSQFKVLHTFSNAGDGFRSVASLLEGTDGALYGTTVYGGSAEGGTVFKMNKDGGAYTVLRAFSLRAGEPYYPMAAVLEGKDGALYGTTSAGGVADYGTVFRLSKDGRCYAVLHNFTAAEGRHPWSGLIQGNDGVFYGTTYGGGDMTQGTVYSLSKANALPYATANTATVPQNSNANNINVLANDSDSDGDALTITSVTQGGHGAVVVTGGGTSLAYTPVAGFSGVDAFTYTISDGHGGTATAAVSVNVGSVTPTPPPTPVIMQLVPNSALAGGPAFTLVVNGSAFQSGTIVFWNGSARPTTLVSGSQLQAAIPASDLVFNGDITTVSITAQNPGGSMYGPVLFTVTSANIGVFQSTVVDPDASVSVATPNISDPLTQPAQVAVTATVNNVGDTGPISATAATYTSNPTGSSVINVGGGYVDLKVAGADASDSATAKFYYSSALTGAAETYLYLLYFNGSFWDYVRSSGGVDPVKNITDNLDGTVSGGRFTVVFDSTSTPKLTELVGTVFTFAIPDTTAPVLSCPPNLEVSADPGQCTAIATYAVTATDDSDSAAVICTPPPGSIFNPGTTTVTCTATDDSGNVSGCSFSVTVTDREPPIIAGQPISQSADQGQCSAAITPTASATDNCDSVTLAGTRSDNQPLNAPYPVGVTTITWSATDAAGNTSTLLQTITVTNPNPVVTLTGPTIGSLYAVNTAVSFSATFTDAGGGVHTGTWSFDNISTPATIREPAGSSPGSATASYTFNSAGVFKVSLTIYDSCAGVANAQQMNGMDLLVVVYDPSAGFVTGSGWINSPAGAYAPNSSLTGKANFGFVSKYQKGSTVPTGETEFQFQLANLNFHSSTYEWLVVSGPLAQYKGRGQINGAGNYGFLLTATDGQVSGGGGVDKFRIKIWDIDHGGVIVYDNVAGASDSINDAKPQPIASGSIVIHK